MTTACLIDTNIILRLVSTAAPEHAAARSAVRRLLISGDRLVIAPQVLYEFWSVATRPVEANGLGLSLTQARTELTSIRARFPMLPESPAVVDIWIEIVTAHELKGKRIHDAHLLATMKANDVTRLLTFNTADFPPDPGVTILSPLSL